MLGLGSLGSQPVSSLDIPIGGNTYSDSITLSATNNFTGVCFVGVFQSINLTETAGFVLANRLDCFPTLILAVTASFSLTTELDAVDSESFNSTSGFVIDPGAHYFNVLNFSETAGYTSDATVGDLTFSSTAGFSIAVEHEIYLSLTFNTTSAHIVSSATVIPLGIELDGHTSFGFSVYVNSAGNQTYSATAGFNLTCFVIAIDSESFNATAGFSTRGGFDYSNSISLSATNSYTSVDDYIANVNLLLFSAAGFGKAIEVDAYPTETFSATTGFIVSDANLIYGSFSFTETAGFVVDGDARQGEIYLVSVTNFIVANQEAAGPPETIGAIASVSFDSGLIANRSVNQILVISSTATFVLEKIQHASNVLTILSSGTKVQEHTRSISNQLIINSEGSTSTTLNRSASNQLFFQSSFTQTIGINGVTINVNNAIATVQKVNCQVVLQSAGSVIVLPCPILGDTQRPTGLTINVMHAINGTLYTIIKKTTLQTLKYTFQLDRRKGLELRLFLQNNLSNLITLYNFKGETWIGYITNQPDLIAKSRWAPCGPMNEVTLDFEGTKTGG